MGNLNLERFGGESAANGAEVITPSGRFLGGWGGNLFRKENKHPRLVHPLKGVGGYNLILLFGHHV